LGSCCHLSTRRPFAALGAPRPFLGSRGAWQRRCRSWLRPSGAAAAAAGAVASAGVLALAEGPVRARERKQPMRQQVFVWGRVQSIPGGAPGDVLWPRRIEWFEQNKAGWAKIAFGPNFGAALDSEGLLYIWGEGKEDFVGPVVLDCQGDGKGRRFTDVQCSSDKIVALTKRGEVLMFEDVLCALRERSEQPQPDASSSSASAPLPLAGRRMPGLPQPGKWNWLFGGGGIKQMGIGLEHAGFVTHRGELYCVGGNEWGQCGTEPPRQKGPMGALEDRSRTEVLLPVKVEFPPEAGPIVSVTIGGRHTIARDAEGKTFAFGDDRRIQLGLGDTRTQGTDERNSYGVIRQEQLGGKGTKQDLKRAVGYRYYDPHMQAKPVQTLAPTVYNRPPYPTASFLACGEDYTIAVHRDSPDWYSKEQETNLLLCCGENGEGQCGRGLQEQQQSWTAVRLPKRSRTVDVACGQAHCLALLTTGDLYGWGSSPQGQLGNGKRAVKSKPIKIGLEPSEVRSEPVNVSPVGAAPEYKAAPVGIRPFPGKVVAVSCGFRNSAVICEIPEGSPAAAS